MKQNTVTYANLRAEMGRKNVSLTELAARIGVNRDTLSRWLSRKSRISLEAAFKIREAAFPEQDVRYLFAEADEGGEMHGKADGQR